MSENTSFWKELQEYIYTTTPGEVIRRAELVKMFPEYATGRQGSTLDTYRRMLTVLGVLDDTEKPGVYKRGNVKLPPLFSKSYAEQVCKKLYVNVPEFILKHECGYDWSFWERTVWQKFKPKSLLDEFYRGVDSEHDPDSLGFRLFRVSCWNSVVSVLDTCNKQLKSDCTFSKIFDAFRE